MNTVEKIDQLAQELILGKLAESIAERKRGELVLLLMQECDFRFDDEDKQYSHFDNCYFAEAFEAALKNYDQKTPNTPFIAFFRACYNLKASGLEADKFAKANPEVFADRLTAMKELIEKIGETEGLDYQYYKNNLRYLNRANIMKQLKAWGVAEKYQQAVEAVLERNKIVYIDQEQDDDEGSKKNAYDILPAVKREDTRLQLLVADIIEQSYNISKARKLYPLNHCEWSGNLYENYDRVIPVVFDIYLEKKYIGYYETQAIWEILDNELLGEYLHYAPDTIRKKRKQLEAINLEAWRKVGAVNG